MKYAKATPLMMSTVKRVVEAHHRRLDGAKIAVIRRAKAAKRGRKTVMATASKPSARMKPLLDDKYSFVVTIAEDIWDVLKPKQRTALVDHELCHCEFNDKGEPSILGHDLEEFAEIIKRYGFWRKDQGEKVVQEALLPRGIKIGTID